MNKNSKIILGAIGIILIGAMFYVFDPLGLFFSHPQGGPKEICAVSGAFTDIKDEHDCFWHGALILEYDGTLNCYDDKPRAPNVIKDINIYGVGSDIINSNSYKTYYKELDYSTGSILKMKITVKGVIPDSAKIRLDFDNVNFGILKKISSDTWATDEQERGKFENCNGINTITIFTDTNSISITQIYMTAEIFTAWNCNEKHPPNLPNYEASSGCSWVVDYPNYPTSLQSRARCYRGDVMCICNPRNPGYVTCPIFPEPNCANNLTCYLGKSRYCRDNIIYENYTYGTCINYRCDFSQIISEEKTEECGLKRCIDSRAGIGLPQATCCSCWDEDMSNAPSDRSYYTKNITYYNGNSYEDFCINDYTLVEYMCLGDPSVAGQCVTGYLGNYTHSLEQQYRSQYLCEDGKFIKLTTTTTTITTTTVTTPPTITTTITTPTLFFCNYDKVCNSWESPTCQDCLPPISFWQKIINFIKSLFGWLK